MLSLSATSKKCSMRKIVLIMCCVKTSLNQTGSKRKKVWTSLVKMGRENGWPFDQHEQTRYNSKASQETEEDVLGTTGDKCLQLIVYVRLEVRKGKLVLPTYPSESKAHLPNWKLICRPLGWDIQAMFGIQVVLLKISLSSKFVFSLLPDALYTPLKTLIWLIYHSATKTVALLLHN